MTQRVLEFAIEPDHGRRSLLKSSANRQAVDWIDRWPDWPNRILALYGPEGCGKTHLARIWREKARAKSLDAASLDETIIAGFVANPYAVVIDDADRIAGNAKGEASLFHLYNLVIETGQFLLLTARDAPARWGIGLPDLSSRLLSVQAIGIEQPDDKMLALLLGKLFADRQLLVPDDVVAYLLARMERSFAAAETLAGRLDELSLIQKRPITLALARTVLEGRETGEIS